jgi:hypothetical protein
MKIIFTELVELAVLVLLGRPIRLSKQEDKSFITIKKQALNRLVF